MSFGSKPLVAAFDLLCCLLIILVLQQNPPKKPPHIPTYGQYAVLISWGDGSNNDVDMYVRDPAGRICYFAAEDVGLMHLEVDDLGTATSNLDGGVKVVHNGERVVIRGAEPGEYTVNVHMYNRADPGPTRVHVALWTLRGNDRVLYERDVILNASGDEHTAFRFTITPSGSVSGYNRLPRKLVGSASGVSTTPPPAPTPSGFGTRDFPGGNGTSGP